MKTKAKETRSILGLMLDGVAVRQNDREGFEVRVRVERDDNPDLRFYGRWSATDGPEAIDRVKHGAITEEDARDRCRYFIPVPRKETGSSRKQQFRDWRRMEAYENGEWSMTGVIATVEKAGVVLGEASLWGIESDAGSYYDEVGEELIQDAIQDAREKLQELCQGGEEV